MEGTEFLDYLNNYQLPKDCAPWIQLSEYYDTSLSYNKGVTSVTHPQQTYITVTTQNHVCTEN